MNSKKVTDQNEKGDQPSPVSPTNSLTLCTILIHKLNVILKLIKYFY